ncbi:hypothetical protein GUJ93_ZPchr0006g41274 [Zizania palustris]|uniref:Uncharacterized protein n=1 Tax=Zizania palustris TaxID=103762 RepID=A0A8J5SKC3_ZIZPA|nr:hypothetical protein GUJ93_ZPchr0006g41274 [Zizania palustris]
MQALDLNSQTKDFTSYSELLREMVKVRAALVAPSAYACLAMADEAAEGSPLVEGMRSPCLVEGVADPWATVLPAVVELVSYPWPRVSAADSVVEAWQKVVPAVEVVADPWQKVLPVAEAVAEGMAVEE